MMATRPTGTISYLFTDIESSTRLWETHPESMQVALARHDEILRQAIADSAGYLVKGRGDGFHAAFSTARQSIEAAVAAQHALQAEPWDGIPTLRARMAIHTGAAEERDGDYFGPAVNRAARLLAASHGGQIVVSEATAQLIQDDLPTGVSLRDLGALRLKDLARPEHIYQVVAPGLQTEFPPIPGLDERPNNLPAQITRFIGRERDLVVLERLLQERRLVSLVGPGGVGKSRLALQVANEVLDEYPDGVWLVQLAPLTDGSLIPQTVATVLRIPERSGEPLETTIIGAVRQKRLLLILDNCEHLVTAAARFVDSLLRHGPQVSILATSREPLAVSGEALWRVRPLPIPRSGRKLDLARLGQYESVRLFLDRAASILPDFTLSSENAPAIEQIVRHLDGLPLAIELAASRVSVLSPEQIAQRLDDRFRLLKGSDRTTLPRQQTLQALIAWSYGLLSTEEQLLFQRASVFGGGFTLEAGEAVCSGDGIDRFDVLDLLASLVEKSMIVVEEHGSDRRYAMLESLRAYGRERLEESGQSAAVCERFARYFLEVAEQAMERLPADAFRRWLTRVVLDADNFRSVFRWSQDHDLELGLRVAAALRPAWWIKGHIQEGLSHLEELLTQPLDTVPAPTRLAAFRALEVLAFRHGDIVVARRAFDAVRVLAQELGNQKLLATVLREWGGMLVEQQEFDEAASLLHESIALHDRLGDTQGIAWARIDLGMLSLGRGDYAEAVEHLEAALAVAEQTDDRWRTTITQYFLSLVSLAQRRHESARAYLSTSLSDSRTEQFQWLLPGILEATAVLAARQGRHERAARIAGTAAAMRESVGARQARFERGFFEHELQASRDALGETWAAAWSAGQAADLEEALFEVRAELAAATERSGHRRPT